MSLWYESLMSCLHGAGNNDEERAKCIIEYLSLPVPRAWWERASETGKPADSHVQILRDLHRELSKTARIGDQLSTGVLIALAFTEDVEGARALEADARADGDVISAALNKAQMVLAARPELRQLADLIDGMKPTL